ncbi:glycosyltransferase family 2 protein [Anaeromassilibacillus senegalensis]|uniref:Glycosyltransferase n=1 Tax=Anaeromassilibacillus senegalensis TaxID=1673717 RepID=A0ABS9CPZ8_9FIRM|nr:glycosyltransferase [Anaeromassilibacillus senegalensis]MCF2652703.1 glycosyltransferase [Anaeromassilibacillus senegalensis]
MPDLISVIVPVYRVAADLPRCLDSILAQTYPHIEIIAVDDGSPDESGAILDCYAANHPNIRAVHKENGGVTSARLRGLQEASGDWIGFVDGDDEIEPDMYARLLENAEKYSAAISHCGYQMVFADGRVNYFHNTGRIVVQDRGRGIRDLLDGTLVEPGLCNKLYRKKLFDGLEGRMDPSIRINEDLLMNYYLFSGAGWSVWEDFCPYHYIVRSTSASRSKLNEHRIYDPLRVKEQILKHIPQELEKDAQRAYVNTCVYTYGSLVLEKEYPTASAKKYIRQKLRTNCRWCADLPKRTKLLAGLIMNVPGVFAIIYPLYVRFVQKSQYH